MTHSFIAPSFFCVDLSNRRVVVMPPKRDRRTASMDTEEIEALMNRPMTFFRVEPYRMMAVEEEFETWVSRAMAQAKRWEQGEDALIAFETAMLAQMAATAGASVARALGITVEVEENTPYKVIHLDILETLSDIFNRMTQSQTTCPVCRQTGRWRHTEETKPWTDAECPVCMRAAKNGIIDPCFHSLCHGCYKRAQSVVTPHLTETEAHILSFCLDPGYIRWAEGRPR